MFELDEEFDEEAEERYHAWLQTKDHFNLDCYYCIFEDSCKDAHTWDTGEKECNQFRGA